MGLGLVSPKPPLITSFRARSLNSVAGSAPMGQEAHTHKCKKMILLKNSGLWHLFISQIDWNTHYKFHLGTLSVMTPAPINIPNPLENAIQVPPRDSFRDDSGAHKYLKSIGKRNTTPTLGLSS